MTIFYVVSGFIVGMLVGFTGVGGGSLMTPLLTVLFGVHPSIAVGTDLAFAAITKTVGVFAHRSKGTVRWDIVRRLCYGALPVAILTTVLLKSFKVFNNHIAYFIRYAIAISVLLTIFSLLFREKLQTWLHAHPKYSLKKDQRVYATVIVGFVLGVLVTISSIGAGAVGATLLSLLYPRLSPAEIAGTDIAYAVPLTMIATVGHWWLGSIDFFLLNALLLGSIPGIIVGSLAASIVSEKCLRRLLILILFGVAVKLVF